nr:glucoside xylosyltransferase 1-like isoform X2 [Procambarus clarkii]
MISWLRIGRTVLLCVVGMTALLVLVYPWLEPGGVGSAVPGLLWSRSSSPESHHPPATSAVPGNSAFSLSRHLRQIRVLLKSAAALTSTTLRFNIVTDTNKTYQHIVNMTLSWPPEYRSRIVLVHHQVYYPPKTENLLKMFRHCSTEKLFLPYLYKEKDILISLDTDLIFMQPPEDLWTEFENFEDRHIVGMAPVHWLYGPGFKAFPTYGTSGLNAGVILMNLTRLRNFTGGWIETILDVKEKYKGKLSLAEQDILNIIFSRERSPQIYELGCEWDFWQRMCSDGYNKCPGAASRGVAIIHGCAQTFFFNQERKIQAVFEVWEKFQLGRPLSELLEMLQTALSRLGSAPAGCGFLSNIDNTLTQGIKRLIKLQQERKSCAT